MPTKESEILSYIRDAMLMSKRSLTVSQIIERMEILGFKFETVYKMSMVRSIINSYPQLFSKDKKGFSLK